MKKILFYGWQTGFQKISNTLLLQEIFNLSLSESKNITDQILDGKQFIMEVSDELDINLILIRFKSIGAKCKVLEE